jgi:uncharacterized protein
VNHQDPGEHDENSPETVEGPDRTGGISWLETGHAEDSPRIVATIACWRCGRLVTATRPGCPHCRARLADDQHESAVSRRPPGLSHGEGLARVLYLYLAMLGVSVAYGWTIDFSRFGKPPTEGQIRESLVKAFVVEGIDALLVLGGIAWASRPPALPRPSTRGRVSGYLGALPVLAILLALNFVIHRVLKDWVGMPEMERNEIDKSGLIAWLVLVVCVQPAIIEELFFRYLALGHLRSILGTNGAVWISGVMFGVMHLFQPLGVPYLILVGVAFGYLRVLTRSMALPMILHFLHNAVVLWAQPWL